MVKRRVVLEMGLIGDSVDGANCYSCNLWIFGIGDGTWW